MNTLKIGLLALAFSISATASTSTGATACASRAEGRTAVTRDYTRLLANNQTPSKRMAKERKATKGYSKTGVE